MRTVKLDGETYKLPPCPNCGGYSMLIVWGYPTRAATLAARRRLVCLGGCLLDPNEPLPSHSCRDCDHDFTPAD